MVGAGEVDFAETEPYGVDNGGDEHIARPWHGESGVA